MSHVVRRVLPSEYHKYRSHLKALDAESRTLRFGFQVKDEILDKLCDGFEKDTSNHVLFCVENAELEFIAIGHVSLQGVMELAFSVHKSHQGQGIGDKLMKRCIRYCRTRKILKGNMVCLTRNSAIKHLCSKNGISFQSSAGESEADIYLDEPQLQTFINEGMAMNSAVIDYTGKRVMLPWTLLTKTIDNLLK